MEKIITEVLLCAEDGKEMQFSEGRIKKYSYRISATVGLPL